MEQDHKQSRRQKAEETRLLVFQTAVNLLDKKNFEDIKVRDIVNEAKVSVGTFYNYYSTKLDVFYETYCLADEYFENTVAAQLIQPHLADRLLFFFDQYAAYSSESTGLTLTKVLYNSSNKQFIRKSPAGMHHILVTTIAKGMEDQQVQTNETAEEMADFLMIAARGQVYDWCIRDGAYNLREAMWAYIHKILQIYF